MESRKNGLSYGTLAFGVVLVLLVDSPVELLEAPAKSTSNSLSILFLNQRRFIFSSLAMGGTG